MPYIYPARPHADPPGLPLPISPGSGTSPEAKEELNRTLERRAKINAYRKANAEKCRARVALSEAAKRAKRSHWWCRVPEQEDRPLQRQLSAAGTYQPPTTNAI